MLVYNCTTSYWRIQTIDSWDKEVFDEDCRRYTAIHPDIPEGVHGGELGTQRSGHPDRSEDHICYCR